MHSAKKQNQQQPPHAFRTHALGEHNRGKPALCLVGVAHRLVKWSAQTVQTSYCQTVHASTKLAHRHHSHVIQRLVIGSKVSGALAPHPVVKAFRQDKCPARIHQEALLQTSFAPALKQQPSKSVTSSRVRHTTGTLVTGRHALSHAAAEQRLERWCAGSSLTRRWWMMHSALGQSLERLRHATQRAVYGRAAIGASARLCVEAGSGHGWCSARVVWTGRW